MGKVSEYMYESIQEQVGIFTEGEKEEQRIFTFERLFRALLVEGHRKDFEIKDEKDLIDFLNRINIKRYFPFQEVHGYHQCIRHNCYSKMHNANFYKTDEGIWVYKCFACADEEAISQAKFIIEMFRDRSKKVKVDSNGVVTYEYLDKYQVLRLIKMALFVNYNNEYYKYCDEVISNNLDFMNNLDKDSNLYKLVSRRKLQDVYKDFLEVASCYTMKQYHDHEGLSFFASKTTLQKFYESALEKKAPAEILGKITLLDALGFIKKVQASEISDDLQRRVLDTQEIMNKLESIKISKDKNKITRVGYIKEVNCFKVEKYDEDYLVKAEQIATYILENKIYNLTNKHRAIIDSIISDNKHDEEIEFLKSLIVNTINKQKFVVEKDLKDALDDSLTKAEKEMIVNNAVEALLLHGGNRCSYKRVNATPYILKTYQIKTNRVLADTTSLIVKVSETEDEAFIKLASRDIEKYFKTKDYILTKNLYKTIDKKCNKYTKAEKEKLIKKNISNILLINELKTIKCNKENIKKLGVKEKCICQDTIIVKK